MKEKILLWSIYISGIFCLYVFISVRFLPVMNTLVRDKMDPESQDFSQYGDLYYMGCIADFREKYPEKVRNFRLSEKHPTIQKADILTFGDSFFAFSFHTTLPERIADSLHQTVYSNITFDPTRANPFCVLGKENFQTPDSAKYLIYESIERNIPARFSEPYPIVCPEPGKSISAKTDKFINKYIFKSSSEALYSVLLKNSYFSKNSYSAISTFKFDLYQYITASTPKYKTGDIPWLFYDKELGTNPGSFYHQVTDEEINTYCENIELLAKNLKEQYNLNMIFVPIPNKYTIYHKEVNNDQYSNFLPMLYEQLTKRNIQYVDLYHPFTESDDVLYWGTDTHWNLKGVNIALEKTVEKLVQ
jgi:hypothetical protein